jgi:hypothetical protein
LNIIKKNKTILYIICWLLLWANLNVDFFIILNFGNSPIDSVNGIRALFPVFILSLLIIYLSFNNYLKQFFDKKNIYLIFFLFFVCQIIGSIENLDNILIINKYTAIQAFGLIISSIASILLIYLIHNEKNKKFEKYLVYSSIIILSIYFIPILINLMWKYSQSHYIYAYHETLIQEFSRDFLKLPISRSTGISRSIIIISIFLLCFNSFKNNKIKNLIHFIIFLMTTSVFLINSKFAITALVIIYSLIIFTNNLYKKHKIKFLVIHILIPFFVSLIIINAKVNIHSDNNKKPILDLKIKILDLKIKNRFIDDFYKDTGISSGRKEIWIKSINIFITEKRYLFGLGAQADRLYLISYVGTEEHKIKDAILSANSSNAILYSLLSGGIISVIVLILFNYILLIRVYKYFFIRSKKYNFNYNLLNFSIFTYLFLLLRSLVENSFTLFSIDFLIYLQCCMIIMKNINFNYKNKISLSK